MKTLRKLVKELDATLEIGPVDQYNHSRTITVDAPDGMEWVDGGCVALVEYEYMYVPSSRQEVIDTLIERVQCGLAVMED